MKNLKVLEWGTGSWGKQHCISLRKIPRAELVGVLGRNPEKASSLASEMGVRGFTSLPEAVTETGAEAVTINLPHSIHRPAALQVIELGLPVYVDKSFGASLKDAEAMANAAEKKGVKLMPGFSQRYEPSYLELARLARSGDLGKLRYVFAKRQSTGGFPEGHWVSDPLLAGGGAVAGWGIHDVDLALHIAASKPRLVYAMMEFDSKGRETQSHMLVEHQEGIISEIAIEYYAFAGDSYAWTLGEKGRADAERTGKLTVYREIGPPETKQFPQREYPAFLTDALNGFVDAVLDDREVPIPAEDGVENWKVVDAAYRSGRTDQPVRIP